VPGAAGRWALPDVNTGLDSMAAMYAAVDTMSNQIVLFTTLQGITMQMLILRLIRVLSAQKRLSILTNTTLKVRMCRAVLCCAVLCCAVLCCAVLCCAELFVRGRSASISEACSCLCCRTH